MELINKDNLIKVISYLISLKKSGLLDEEKYLRNQDRKWRNLLEYSILESCMKHHCPFVRLSALTLISESKKTTQVFASAELNLILSFLEYNLGEKLEFVPLMKKIIKRVNDSLTVLQRDLTAKEKLLERNEKNTFTSDNELIWLINESTYAINITVKSYYFFLSSLKDICLRNLYPGAVHCRRHSALQILNLLEEFLNKDLPCVLWNQSNIEPLVHCLLVDSYDTNKELAFKIIKNIEPSILNLNNIDAVHEIIDTALQLANSLRPTDPTTAFYMLKMFTLSPITDDVLCNYIDSDKIKSFSEDTLLKIIVMLLNCLKKQSQLAKKNITLACSKHSLYGYLFCIQSLLKMFDPRTLQHQEPWQKLVAELIDICFELSNIVSEIVNNSSPEGHLPMDLNLPNVNSLHNSEEYFITSQMVLLCSWRTIKETSLLLGNITSKCPIYNLESTSGLLSEEQIVKIGEHFVSLLCETKHRGAFEQTYVGFQLMCNRLWSSKNESLRRLLLTWLHCLFLDMSGLNGGHFNLCVTRRSAGVPFLVQAIICSATQDKSDCSVFHSVMRILIGFARLEESESSSFDLNLQIKLIMYKDTVFSQFEGMFNTTNDLKMVSKDVRSNCNVMEIKTHSLNILRALFKHFQLGELVKDYISEGFKVAMRSYDGKFWAERNAATLLIGSLITRTFGVLRTKDYINLTAHNKMTGVVFFDRNADLLPYMLEKLHFFITKDSELYKCSILPILLIISRLYIGSGSKKLDSGWQVDIFIDLVSKCGTNRVQKTRELAARALVSLLTEENLCGVLKLLITNVVNAQENPNALHGYMLQFQEILSTFPLTTNIISQTNFCDFLMKMEHSIIQSLEYTSKKFACFPAATCFVNILSILLERSSIRSLFDQEFLDNIFIRFQIHLKDRQILKERPGTDLYESVVINLILSSIRNSFLSQLLKNENENTDFWLSALTHVNMNVQIVSWRNIFIVIEKTRNVKLLEQAIFISVNTRFESVGNFEVQDAIYEFLSVILSHLQEQNSRGNIYSMSINNYQSRFQVINQFCTIIAKILETHVQEKFFVERGNFLKLLGKNYACVSQTSEDNFSIPMGRNNIYKVIVKNSWMSSSDLDCRIEIAKNLHDFYIESSDEDESCLVLNWWTTLLYLLLDDNLQVRQYASIVICNVKPKNNLECYSSIMQVFFEKFTNIFRNKNPAAGLAALIFWSISFIEEEEEFEIDETEVFNRCVNYECFEPLRISRKCNEFIGLIIHRYSIDELIPVNVKSWLSDCLNLQLCEINTFRDLAVNYERRVPRLNGKLQDILDPSYNSKLMQLAAYKSFQQQCLQIC